MPAPQFSEAEAQQVLQADFGLEGQLVPLVSERDQNFRLTTASGQRFVFKIANASEPRLATDFQVAALLYLQRQQCPVATPRLQRTVDGNSASWIGGAADNQGAHRCRVVSFLPGELLSSVEPGAQVAAQLGECAARLDLALEGFAHAGESQVLLWDLQRAGRLRDILEYVDDAELRRTVRACIDDFEQRVLPALPGLRCQVIHSDLNPDNVLLSPAGQVAGVIDFGDMLRAPLIMELAIAASYLRPPATADVLTGISPCVAAYDAVVPLYDEELELLFDLVRARLATSITILRWRFAVRGAGDAYSEKNLDGESGAAGFLAGLDRLGRDRFLTAIRKSIKNN